MTIEAMKKDIKSIPPLTVMLDGKIYAGYVRGARLTYAVVKVDCNGEPECLQFSWEAIQKAVQEHGILMG